MLWTRKKRDHSTFRREESAEGKVPMVQRSLLIIPYFLFALDQNPNNACLLRSSTRLLITAVEERRLMHLVPAPAVRLKKRRVLSRPGVNSLLAHCLSLLLFYLFVFSFLQ